MQIRFSAHNADTTQHQRALRSVPVMGDTSDASALKLIREYAQELVTERGITVVIRRQTLKNDGTIQSSMDYETIIADADMADLVEITPTVAEPVDEFAGLVETPGNVLVNIDDRMTGDMLTIEMSSEDAETFQMSGWMKTTDGYAGFLEERAEAETPAAVVEHAPILTLKDEATGASKIVPVTADEAIAFERSGHPYTVNGFARFIDAQNETQPEICYVLALSGTPDAYYGFGFKPIETRGDFIIVAGPDEHSLWMMNRLQSGMYCGSTTSFGDLDIAQQFCDEKTAARHPAPAKAIAPAKTPRTAKTLYAKNGEAGLVNHSTNTRIAKAEIKEYYAPQADASLNLDTKHGPWVIVCVTHNQTLSDAVHGFACDMMSQSPVWCSECANNVDQATMTQCNRRVMELQAKYH